jgi:hypothetical protein
MMKKKVWLVLLAMVLVSVLAIFGCGGGGGDDDDDDDDKDELVEKVVFDLATDEGIQALTVGELSFADKANPIKPLVRAGGDTNVSFEAIAGTGEQKIALKFTVGDANWGAGFDMRFGPGDGADGFGFRVGDNIKIKGELLTIGDGVSPGTGVRRLAFNKKVGAENATIGGVVTTQTEVGEINLDITLAADDLTDIKGGNPAGIRAEGRSGGMVVRIDNITITGMRPSNIKALAAPVITLTGSEISWTEIEGAGGYMIYKDDVEAPFATTLNTSYDLASLAAGTYSITVAAKGVAGSSKDSPKSNAVSFTKVASSLPAGYTEIFGKLDGARMTWYSDGCDDEETTLDIATFKAAKYLILKAKSNVGENGIGGLQLAIQGDANNWLWTDATLTPGWTLFDWLVSAEEDDFYFVINLTLMANWATFSGDAGTKAKFIHSSDNSDHVTFSSLAYLVDDSVTLTMPGTNATAFTESSGACWAAKVVAGL